MSNISQVAGNSPITLKAQMSEPITTGNTGTVIVRNLCGKAVVPVLATGFVGTIGAGAATLDVQVAAASIMTAPITLVANSAVAGTVTSGTVIPNATDISFIFANASGGNITEVAGNLTCYVAHQ